MTIFRVFYNLLWWLIIPLVKRYLRRRAQKTPAYLEYWDERFGQEYSGKTGAIWFHAVSVGETRAAQPLIEALCERFPGVPLLITQMTPTGRETAKQLYPEADIRYLPYDRPAYITRFFNDHQPRLGVLMETELWPNLIFGAQKAGVPLFLANARLSEKSQQGYQRIGMLIRPSLQALTGIAAQTVEDASRLKQLGAKEITVCGNTKFDVTPPPRQLTIGETFRRLIGSRPVVVCASTRDGEEALILQAWRSQRDKALLVLIPRHPERFSVVEALAKEMGYRVQQRSTDETVYSETDIWLGDSMGEMFAYYAIADIAFIGGSLLPFGGQNLIEAAAMGVPVLFGPSMFNFQQASILALEAGAACQVADAQQLVQTVVETLQHSEQRQRMSHAALAFSSAHQGASHRITEYILKNYKNNT